MDNNRFGSGRARHAYEAVKAGLQDAEKQKEFASSAKKIGMLVKINGLVPALLFAREKQQFGSIHEDVLSWLTAAGSPVQQFMQHHAGIEGLTSLNSSQYRLVTAETQRYLAWVKRFASALVKEENA